MEFSLSSSSPAAKFNKQAAIELFVISLVSLFFELTVIRWLSSEIRIFAYFKNIPLMACLFGLGLGMALGGNKRDISRWFPCGLLAIVALICMAQPLHLVHISFINPMENYLIGDFIQKTQEVDSPLRRLKLFVPGLVMLVGVFYLIVFVFACIGQRLGALFKLFPPLIGYNINVWASLIGILAFTAVSFVSLPPPMWLSIGVLICAYYYRRPMQLGAFALAIIMSFCMSKNDVLWSPYYRISLDKCIYEGDATHPPFEYGYNVNVNYDTIEGAYNNNPAVLAKLSDAQRKATADYYNTPYLALGDKPRSVLILAAGTGNDVAAALRHGAIDVDAVEIDPTILQLGRKLHPEHPYDDPRVHPFVDDARAYLRRCKKKYDLIVFGYLDSHSAFSSMSSLRLDNYVYTRESFNDAGKLLKPNGVMSVTFYYLAWWQLARVYHSLVDGYGSTPMGVYSPSGNGPTFLVGPGLDKAQIEKCGLKPFIIAQAAKEFGFNESEWVKVVPTTDDWPYLFLREPGVSWTYGIGLLMTLMMGWRLVGRCFGRFATDAPGKMMFCLGAAFMLLETKSIIQMGLIAGTTWIVNSTVIAAVLLMILLANMLQMKCNFQNFKILFGFLFATLLINFLIPVSSLNALPPESRLFAGGLLLGAPFFFAAIIFAVTFSKMKDPSLALGMNLLGTLVGGALEYLSLATGTNALNGLAMLLYGAAFYYSRNIGAAPAAEGSVASAEASITVAASDAGEGAGEATQDATKPPLD
jgi:SAM-dependent methyltransferase